MINRDFVLDSVDADKRRSALNTLLVDFDVPARRVGEFNLSNLRWLDRNLAINNGSNPMLFVVTDLISWLIRWETRKSRGVRQ